MDYVPAFELSDEYAFTSYATRAASVRRLSDMLDVLMNVPEDYEDRVLYYMYRDVWPSPIYDLRVDITRLLPGVLPDGELNRTHGHYHSLSPFGREWPELYGVIEGKGLFVLQDKGGRVYLVEVERGDVVLIPPGYGHVMVNLGKTDLITFNYVSKSNKSDYGSYKEKRGPAVYVVADDRGYKVIRNDNYNVKKLCKCKPIYNVCDLTSISYSYRPSLEEWLACECQS